LIDYSLNDYGERIADLYDDLYSWYEPTRAQLDFIEGHAAGGTVVEIGAGTGRLALPLARRGVEVLAVDSSPRMLRILRTKAEGLPVHLVVADAAGLVLRTPVSVVLAAFNFVTLLAGRAGQRDFLRCAADALAPDGVLVVELLVPREADLPGAAGFRVISLSATQVILEAGRHHRGAQRCDFQHIVLRDREPVRLIPASMHYLFPDQLDSLAAEAGLRLRNRFADWRGRPFTEHSAAHVSVYGRA
jgi:SAM-dependent methyltransferase